MKNGKNKKICYVTQEFHTLIEQGSEGYLARVNSNSFILSALI